MIPEVLPGYQKKLDKNCALILEIFLISLSFVLTNMQLSKHDFPFFFSMPSRVIEIVTKNLTYESQFLVNHYHLFKSKIVFC